MTIEDRAKRPDSHPNGSQTVKKILLDEVIDQYGAGNVNLVINPVDSKRAEVQRAFAKQEPEEPES